MIRGRWIDVAFAFSALLALLALTVLTAAEAKADPVEGAETPADETEQTAPEPPPEAVGAPGLEFINPEMADGAWNIEPGPRPFSRRFSISPGYGSLGGNRLYTLRAAYNPNRMLGYELAFGHNPGDAVHAMLHTFNVVARYPIPWRVQPYVTGGYGMLMVFPGQTLNADPVTKNTLVFGGGVELYIRDDVALRAEARRAGVFGVDDADEIVTLTYSEATVGLAFYRSLTE